jgi:hypothetical protein
MTSPRHLGVARALSTLLAIALGISACGGNTADNKPVDLSDSTQVNVVALFDRSGSTATTSGGNGSRVGIERAIWPAVFFPNLGRGYSLKVLPVGFASEAKAWCEWPDDPTGNEQAMSQDLGCRTQLENILPKAVGGNTFFDKALTLAAEQLGAVSGTNVVLLVSDGEYNQGGPDINCAESESSKACTDLKSALDQLNGGRATVCPIFVKTRASTKASATMQWLRELQNQNDSGTEGWTQTSCPASTEIDLIAAPWRLTEDLLVWYAEDLAGLQLRSTTVDGSGRTQNPIRVPNGAAQIAMIGLKRSSSSTVTFNSAACEPGDGQTFKSFTYKPVISPLVDGERCAGGEIGGTGLVPNENSLYALFVPENQELAACIPSADGGGILKLRPGFADLLTFNPRVVWVSPKGETEDPQLKPEQLLKDGLALTEDQASKLASLGGDWRIALDFTNSITQPGKGESYSLLYESVLLRNGDASSYPARRPISATIDSVPCAPLFERSLLQRFWMFLVGLLALVMLIILWRLLGGLRIDLAGDLAILDGTGSRSMGSTSISGGSPSWFNVGDRGKIEPGKGEDGKNWRLRWRGGTNVSLEPADGEVGDWSEGTVKSERGRGFIEFKRVPLIGGSETNTIRYTPEEGTKMGELISKELEDPE